jgi:hypothetical protein
MTAIVHAEMLLNITDAHGQLNRIAYRQRKFSMAIMTMENVYSRKGP